MRFIAPDMTKYCNLNNSLLCIVHIMASSQAAKTFEYKRLFPVLGP